MLLWATVADSCTTAVENGSRHPRTRTAAASHPDLHDRTGTGPDVHNRPAPNGRNRSAENFSQTHCEIPLVDLRTFAEFRPTSIFVRSYSCCEKTEWNWFDCIEFDLFCCGGNRDLRNTHWLSKLPQMVGKQILERNRG
jgi:hypothetical protein